MLKKLLMATVVASSLIAVGCSSMPSSAQQQQNLNILQNKNWVLTHIGATEYKTDASAHNVPSIQFNEAEKRVSGADGCNRIMGSYAIQGEQITLSQMAGTMMMCTNTMELANKYNEALGKVAGYQVYDQTLRLLDRHGNPVLKYKISPQAQ